jgi:hypothetical protein
LLNRRFSTPQKNKSLVVASIQKIIETLTLLLTTSYRFSSKKVPAKLSENLTLARLLLNNL